MGISGIIAISLDSKINPDLAFFSILLKEEIKFLFIFFPSTIIKLEIAFTSVSTVLTVNDIAKIINTIYNNSDLSFNNIEKKLSLDLPCYQQRLQLFQ